MPNDHIGLLLTNLGSPESTELKDIQQYLTAFLMDKRVVDFPYLFRKLLVSGMIVPKRAPFSAESYKKIWQPAGSPLIINAENLAKRVKALASFPVALSMRYGNPSTERAFGELLAQDPELKEVIVLPLYPQYTMSSFDTAVEEVKSVHRSANYAFKIKFLSPFYNHPDYISCLAASIKPFLEKGFDKILFSYHGIPERHIKKDDARIVKGKADFKLPGVNYQKQAFEMTALTAKQLQIPEAKFETSFQSRLTSARAKWIQPYTDHRLRDFPKEGVKKLLVVCPAFINDCLETIQEIGMEGKETFVEAGGEQLTLIPCINDQEQFAKVIVNWAANGQ